MYLIYIQALVKCFGKWPAFILLVMVTCMPLLLALFTSCTSGAVA